MRIFGRSLQLLALLVMPAAIWVGHFNRDEKGALTIFLGSIVIFFFGWLLVKGR